MKKVKFYYGMSGAMKGTTIKKLEEDDWKTMYSAIKRWKAYEFGLFSGLSPGCDLNFGMLHLIRLEDFLESCTAEKIIIERGITDSMFYYLYSDEFGERHSLSDDVIKKAIKVENDLLKDYEVQRILLIQKDEGFIRTHVLNEPFRKKTFKDNTKYYLEMQEKYVNHTLKFEKMDEVIEIKNAKDYLESLGIEFKY